MRLPAAAPPRSPENELRNAVFGVALIAVACVTVVVGFVAITGDRTTTPAPAELAFDFCRTSGGANCVLDGQTFRLAGQPIALVGIDAPAIHPSRCSQEANLGISAAVRLRALLNRGPVTVTGAGQVEVNGQDVGKAMVASGTVRELRPEPYDWCQTLAAE